MAPLSPHTRRGRSLDCELKQFRLAGDALMEGGAALELSTVLMPRWFLPLACTGARGWLCPGRVAGWLAPGWLQGRAPAPLAPAPGPHRLITAAADVPLTVPLTACSHALPMRLRPARGTAANLAKNLAAVAASSTRAPIYRTFALQNNLADVTAKGGRAAAPSSAERRSSGCAGKRRACMWWLLAPGMPQQLSSRWSDRPLPRRPDAPAPQPQASPWPTWRTWWAPPPASRWPSSTCR